jgi:imidazolonepropionase
MTLLLGPFKQALTLRGLNQAGALSDKDLEIIPDAGVEVADGRIQAVKPYKECSGKKQECGGVVLPGFVDAHSHLCYGGDRAGDYALKLQGKSYHEISKMGGGILKTVNDTLSEQDLKKLLEERLNKLSRYGITTCEVKSGYGLSVESELSLLKTIKDVKSSVDVIPTCLAAHTCPLNYTPEDYIEELIHNFPRFKKLVNRLDIFADKGGFEIALAKLYLAEGKKAGFALTLHADQFTRGGALLAAEMGAVSADHLEVSETEDFLALKAANVVPVMLPGACLGLGIPFPKARLALDLGLPLAIASDTNPGSSPMGNLIAEASLLGIYEKLSNAELFSGLTFRGARALQLSDRGRLVQGMKAHFAIFDCNDYREIFYYQGSLHAKTLSFK